MRVAFFSNYLNHHQLPFCMEMCRLTDNNFTFVATEAVGKERLEMGYEDMDSKYPFVLREYESDQAKCEAEKLAVDCDVMILGSAPEKYVKLRMSRNKMTFRYSERLYKRGIWRAISPRGMKNIRGNHTRYRKKPIYMLCSSAYTSLDFAINGAYINKTFKWGYFPVVKQYDIASLMSKKMSAVSAEHKVKILWAGRFLDFKHLEMAVYLAQYLKANGCSFEMDIIGGGELCQKLENLIKQLDVADCVRMPGFMSPQKVREYMESADIYLFTSDFGEGWGAVLNEAMNSGCAVVASHAIGSVPFLLENGVNGVVYKNGSQQSLNNAVMDLINNAEKRKKMCIEAYNTMAGKWNPRTAAERFVKLCEALQENKDTPFSDGPCSRARILHNNWFKG